MTIEPVIVYLGLIRKATTHVVWSDDAISRSQILDHMAIVKGPGRIPMEQDDGITLPLVQVMVSKVTQ